MDDGSATERLDRHALVMAIWLPLGFVATALLHVGLTGGGAWWIGAGFAAIIAAFTCHVIANAVLGTSFTYGETALGAVAYAAAVLAVLATLLFASEPVAGRILLPVALGLAALLAAVILYLVIAFGARGAFERFDVIRDNNLRAASRLPHRGGRR
jgi:hypothetical protein